MVKRRVIICSKCKGGGYTGGDGHTCEWCEGSGVVDTTDYDQWARDYDELNGAPENDEDR